MLPLRRGRVLRDLIAGCYAGSPSPEAQDRVRSSHPGQAPSTGSMAPNATRPRTAAGTPPSDTALIHFHRSGCRAGMMAPLKGSPARSNHASTGHNFHRVGCDHGPMTVRFIGFRSVHGRKGVRRTVESRFPARRHCGPPPRRRPVTPHCHPTGTAARITAVTIFGPRSGTDSPNLKYAAVLGFHERDGGITRMCPEPASTISAVDVSGAVTGPGCPEASSEALLGTSSSSQAELSFLGEGLARGNGEVLSDPSRGSDARESPSLRAS